MKKLAVLSLLGCILLNMPVAADSISSVEEDERRCLEQSVSCLYNMGEYETDITFSMPVQEGIELTEVTNVVTAEITEILAEKSGENAFTAAEYPLIPSDGTGISYMYWYQPEEERCISSSLKIDENNLQICLAAKTYETDEISDVKWDDLPFGLKAGDGEDAVWEAIALLPKQHIIAYEGSSGEGECYTVFLPEHEELEYMQLHVNSMVYMHTFGEYVDEPVTVPYNKLFRGVTYHWKTTTSGKETIDTISMVHETMGEKWSLEDNAVKDGYTWERRSENVLADDELLNTDIWEKQMKYLCNSYDKMTIGNNEFDNHVYFEYNAENAIMIDIVKAWMK